MLEIKWNLTNLASQKLVPHEIVIKKIKNHVNLTSKIGASHQKIKTSGCSSRQSFFDCAALQFPMLSVSCLYWLISGIPDFLWLLSLVYPLDPIMMSSKRTATSPQCTGSSKWKQLLLSVAQQMELLHKLEIRT